MTKPDQGYSRRNEIKSPSAWNTPWHGRTGLFPAEASPTDAASFSYDRLKPVLRALQMFVGPALAGKASSVTPLIEGGDSWLTPTEISVYSRTLRPHPTPVGARLPAKTVSSRSLSGGHTGQFAGKRAPTRVMRGWLVSSQGTKPVGRACSRRPTSRRYISTACAGLFPAEAGPTNAASFL